MALAFIKDSQMNTFLERTTVVESQDKFDLSKWEIELKAIYDKNNYKGVIGFIHRFIESVITHVSNKSYHQQILTSRNCFSLLRDIVKEEWRYVFVKDITQFIFDVIIEENAECWCMKKELLKIFNIWIQQTESVSRLESVKCLSKMYLFKMVDNISSYGDYDLQITIIETIFRMYGRVQICAKLKELIPESETLSQTFAEINPGTFDEDCRIFLNTINQKYEKIFSIVCENVLIEDSVCLPPMDDLGGLWVDFNICDKAISWYRKIIHSTVDTSQIEEWELITLFASELESAEADRKPDAVFIHFHFKSSGLLISSSEQDEQFLNQAKSVLMILKRNEESEKLLKDVLPKILGKLCQASSKPQKKCSSAKINYKSLNIKVNKMDKSLISEVSSTYNAFNPLSKHNISSGSRSAGSNKNGSTNLVSSESVLEVLTISSMTDPNENLPDEANNSFNENSQKNCDSIEKYATPEQNTENLWKVSKHQGTNSSSDQWKTAEAGTSESFKISKEVIISSNKPNLNEQMLIPELTEDFDSLKVLIAGEDTSKNSKKKVLKSSNKPNLHKELLNPELTEDFDSPKVKTANEGTSENIKVGKPLPVHPNNEVVTLPNEPYLNMLNLELTDFDSLRMKTAEANTSGNVKVSKSLPVNLFQNVLKSSNKPNLNKELLNPELTEYPDSLRMKTDEANTSGNVKVSKSLPVNLFQNVLKSSNKPNLNKEMLNPELTEYPDSLRMKTDEANTSENVKVSKSLPVNLFKNVLKSSNKPNLNKELLNPELTEDPDSLRMKTDGANTSENVKVSKSLPVNLFKNVLKSSNKPNLNKELLNPELTENPDSLRMKTEEANTSENVKVSKSLPVNLFKNVLKSSNKQNLNKELLNPELTEYPDSLRMKTDEANTSENVKVSKSLPVNLFKNVLKSSNKPNLNKELLNPELTENPDSLRMKTEEANTSENVKVSKSLPVNLFKNVLKSSNKQNLNKELLNPELTEDLDSLKVKTVGEGTSENIKVSKCITVSLTKKELLSVGLTKDFDLPKVSISQYYSSEKENITKVSTMKSTKPKTVENSRTEDVQVDSLSLKVCTGNKATEENEEKLDLDHSMDFAEQIIYSCEAINIVDEKTTSNYFPQANSLPNQEGASKKTKIIQKEVVHPPESPENIPSEEFDGEVWDEMLENDIINALNELGEEYEVENVKNVEQQKLDSLKELSKPASEETYIKQEKPVEEHQKVSKMKCFSKVTAKEKKTNKNVSSKVENVEQQKLDSKKELSKPASKETYIKQKKPIEEHQSINEEELELSSDYLDTKQKVSKMKCFSKVTPNDKKTNKNVSSKVENVEQQKFDSKKELSKPASKETYIKQKKPIEEHQSINEEELEHSSDYLDTKQKVLKMKCFSNVTAKENKTNKNIPSEVENVEEQKLDSVKELSKPASEETYIKQKKPVEEHQSINEEEFELTSEKIDTKQKLSKKQRFTKVTAKDKKTNKNIPSEEENVEEKQKLDSLKKELSIVLEEIYIKQEKPIEQHQSINEEEFELSPEKIDTKQKLSKKKHFTKVTAKEKKTNKNIPSEVVNVEEQQKMELSKPTSEETYIKQKKPIEERQSINEEEFELTSEKIDTKQKLSKKQRFTKATAKDKKTNKNIPSEEENVEEQQKLDSLKKGLSIALEEIYIKQEKPIEQHQSINEEEFELSPDKIDTKQKLSKKKHFTKVTAKEKKTNKNIPSELENVEEEQKMELSKPTSEESYIKQKKQIEEHQSINKEEFEHSLEKLDTKQKLSKKKHFTKVTATEKKTNKNIPSEVENVEEQQKMYSKKELSKPTSEETYIKQKKQIEEHQSKEEFEHSLEKIDTKQKLSKKIGEPDEQFGETVYQIRDQNASFIDEISNHTNPTNNRKSEETVGKPSNPRDHEASTEKRKMIQFDVTSHTNCSNKNRDLNQTVSTTFSGRKRRKLFNLDDMSVIHREETVIEMADVEKVIPDEVDKKSDTSVVTKRRDLRSSQKIENASKRPEEISKERTERVSDEPDINSAIEVEKIYDKNVIKDTDNKINKRGKERKDKKSAKEKVKTKSFSLKTNTTKRTNFGNNKKNFTCMADVLDAIKQTEKKHRRYVKLNATTSSNSTMNRFKHDFEKKLDSWRQVGAKDNNLKKYLDLDSEYKNRKRITEKNRAISELMWNKKKSCSKTPKVVKKPIRKKNKSFDIPDLEKDDLLPINPKKHVPVTSTPILDKSINATNKRKIVILSDIPLDPWNTDPLMKRPRIQEFEDESYVPTSQKNNIKEPELDHITVSEVHEQESGRRYAECLLLQSAPSWTATAFFNNETVTIKSNDFIGKYLVMFFYPLDFAFMPYAEPPSEILSINENYEKFLQLNTEVIGCSVDFPCTHHAWVKCNLDMQTESRHLKFPLIADFDHKISQDFMIYSDRLCHSHRGFYVIDPDGIIIAISRCDIKFRIPLDEIFARIRNHQLM